MANKTSRQVVILYEHALLGEGIAECLLAQLGVEATVASALEPQAVISALALGPGVVIFELTESLRRVDLTTLAPRAVLIDVSTVVTRGPALCSPAAAGVQGILQVVRKQFMPRLIEPSADVGCREIAHYPTQEKGLQRDSIASMYITVSLNTRPDFK